MWVAWAGNAGIIVGLYLVGGGKLRVGQLALASGALAWGTVGVLSHDWALASLNTVTFCLAMRGWFRLAVPTTVPTPSERFKEIQQYAKRPQTLEAYRSRFNEWDDPPGLRGPSRTSLDLED